MRRFLGVLASSAVLGFCAASSSAAEPLTIERVLVVGRAEPGGLWTDAPTEARTGSGAELSVVVLAREGRRRVVLADAAVVPLRIEGRRVADRERRDVEALGPAEVRWSTVEPHGFRVGPAANGATAPYYTNVSTTAEDFGRWLGYDTIDYFETVQGTWATGAEARRRAAAVTSSEAGAVQVQGVGTVRYKVELRLASGATFSSPGAEAVDRFGLLPSVHRVSVRPADDFMGWLGAYLLVPEVFGSAGGGANHQTERFTGADCADVMVGAFRRMGRTDVRYTNVAGLVRHTRVVAEPTVISERGQPERPIAAVQRGDLIRIDYGGAYAGRTPRTWDHVAALWEDRSDPNGPHRGAADGQLDGFDVVAHMGHPRLKIEPLGEQMPATVDVLRWREGRPRHTR
ncbi:MAG: hypothetical protein IPI43_10390 [Sandaracinaceae bacterium]|nr:hypothetical protein [Sandaracinaceae bacterium]